MKVYYQPKTSALILYSQSRLMDGVVASNAILEGDSPTGPGGGMFPAPRRL